MVKMAKRLNKKGHGKLTQGSIVKRIMSLSKLQSKNKTQNSKISTHERVGSYTYSSRKTHLPQAQANIQLQKTIQNSFKTQGAVGTSLQKIKNFPLTPKEFETYVYTIIPHTPHTQLD